MARKRGPYVQRPDPLRRLLLGLLAAPALPLLQGCAAPLPALPGPGAAADARAVLAASAAAHGLAALADISDVNASYAGEWRALVGRLQPDLVDAGFRGGSEERLLLQAGIVAQAHAGPDGRKQVLRRQAPGAQGSVHVWFNGKEAEDAPRRSAAALVADAYSLFLLGPMLLARQAAAGRTPMMAPAGAERIEVDGRSHDCDVVRVDLAPGLGFSASDQVALYIDRQDRLMRRVRFTLDGLESTRGALAEVDASGHLPLHGVRWPTRFRERLLRPLPLPVHDWRLTGLDVNRGLDAETVSGAAFTGAAAAPAASLS